MSAILRQIVATKRQLLNSHEQYGRLNIAKCVIATYISAYFSIRIWKGCKAKKLEQQKLALKHDVARDALARTGLL